MRASRLFLTFSLLVLPLSAQTLKPIVVQTPGDIMVEIDAPDTVIDLRTVFTIDGVTGTIARFETIRGLINVELFDQRTPFGVTNFLAYADQGRYDDTLIHRSIPGFVIQGGGFKIPNPATEFPPAVETFDPILNEPGISNTRGTLAWARTSDLNSATSEWYFNTVDNPDLDAPDSPYSVFGRVIGDSILVVDALAEIRSYDLDGDAANLFDWFPLINPVLATENFVTISQVRSIPMYPTEGTETSALTFSASSSEPALVAVTVDKSELRLTFAAGMSGTAVIAVQCADSDGANALVSFGVEIESSAPTITAQPLGRSVRTGGTLALEVQADSTSALSYQWRRNGLAILGATAPVHSIDDAAPSHSGAYDVVVSNDQGSVTSGQAFVSVVDEMGYLVNLSARAVTSDDFPFVLTTPGFVVRGNGTARILSRAIGPGLTQFGVQGVVPDTLISLSPLGEPSITLVENDNWGESADVGELTDAFAQTGAFSLEAGSLDSSFVTSVGQGVYTAGCYSKDGQTIGVVLGEIYLVDASASGEAALVNLSNRGHVGTDVEVMIAGFVVAGDGPVNLLIRGVGPTLAGFGVEGVLEDPILTVRNAEESVVGTNDNWEDDNLGSSLAGISSTVGAFALDADSNDAALMLVLEPGVYTAVLSGRDNGTGTGLLEIYLVE